MRAVISESAAARVADRPTPVVSTDDVIVEVASAGLNAADLAQIAGFYNAPPGWPPDILGMELAGTVIDVASDVDASLMNQRVCCIVGGGALSEQCRVPARHLLHVPESIGNIDAGGFAEAFTTAYDALIVQGQLQPRERLLVSGAAGGVGTAAVQLGAAFGADVVAVVRDTRHTPRLIELGASAVITMDDLAEIEPVNVVIELVGAAHLDVAQRVLAPHARVVVIGVGSGSTANIELFGVMMKRWKLMGSTLRSRSNEEKADLAERLRRDVLPLWAAGQLSVPIAATYDVSDIAAAYDFFRQPGKLGKVIVTFN